MKAPAPESLFNEEIKEILVQVFSCEFYEISKDTLSYRTLPVASSAAWQFLLLSILAKNMQFCEIL